jgi:hypothetical protein
VNRPIFHCKTDTLLIFVPIIIKKKKNKMTADKINTFDVLIEIQEEVEINMNMISK